MLLKCCTQFASKFRKLSSSHSTGKRQFSFPVPKTGNGKECSNRTIGLIAHTSKVVLKILQMRLQQYTNWELPDVQAAFKKGRVTKDQIANIRGIIEKAREFQKNIYYCFIDHVYLTYMQSTSWEMLGWKKQKLKSRLPGEISITSDRQMTPPLWQKAKWN